MAVDLGVGEMEGLGEDEVEEAAEGVLEAVEEVP